MVDEEQFGPILPLVRYRDVDEAIARANANPNGLGGSIWSNDLERAHALKLRLECGTAWINEHGAIQPDAPFGAWGLHEFTSIQTLKVMKPQAAR